MIRRTCYLSARHLHHHHHRCSFLFSTTSPEPPKFHSLKSIKMEGANESTREAKENVNQTKRKIFVAGAIEIKNGICRGGHSVGRSRIDMLADFVGGSSIGATGRTGKSIVEQLLAKGFEVKAAVRDLAKARATFSRHGPSLQMVVADVTEGSDKLVQAIGDDSEAVICATGFRPGLNLFAPWKVENLGTVNLVEACRKLGVQRFILISSILVNGAAMGQMLNRAYLFLNIFGLILVAKHKAENHIRKSGINYTIIRPAALKNEPPSGNLVMEPEDTLYDGTISRDLVAEVAVEALDLPEASYKVVEIASRADAPKRTYEDLFGSIKQK